MRSGYKAVSDFLGGGYEDKLWNFFEAGKPVIDELLKELGREDEKAKALEIYRSHKPTIHPYPGVIEIIRDLRNRGIKIGISQTAGRKDSIISWKLWDWTLMM